MITIRFVWIALLLQSCAVSSVDDSRDSLILIHVNDTYRVDAVEEGRQGGFGRVATIVRQLATSGSDVRILHGGDFLYPSLESQLWDGEQMVEAMNHLDDLAPLYVVPGNHEFDSRNATPLIARLKESNFDWLGDNLRLSTGDPQADQVLQQAFTFSVGNRTIGIFALTMQAEDEGDRRAYAPIDARYVDVARLVMRQFETKGVDAIIGLTHLNLADDIEVARLKAEFPRFLLIAGGHEHEPEFRAGNGQNAIIVKGASNARAIWRVDLQFAGNEASVAVEKMAVDDSIEPDPRYQPIAEHWRTRLLALMPFLPARIGTATMPLDAREVTIRSREAAWGNFITDQMRTAFYGEPADLAFINSGTLRIDDYIAEDITFEDVARTFGFPSRLRYLSISGAEFRRMLEAGYRGTGSSKGYFPQVSGFRVCVDRRLNDASRIVSLQLPVADEWQEISDEELYSLVMPDYLFGGGDGYRVPADRQESASPPGSELKYLVLDAIIEATAEGKTVGATVDPAAPRFVELGPDRQDCFP